MTRYISAEKLDRDDFGDKFTKEQGELVYDAVTRLGFWATMTHKSFGLHGRGVIGTGRGQKYQRNVDGQLHKVQG